MVRFSSLLQSAPQRCVELCLLCCIVSGRGKGIVVSFCKLSTGNFQISPLQHLTAAQHCTHIATHYFEN